MLSINGTTNYSTARIDGKIIVDQSAEIAQLQFDTQAITYNDVTTTTNISSNLSVAGTTQFTGGLAGPLDISGNVSIKNGNLVIYDKSSPTPFPYTFKTVGKHLEFHYTNGIDYTIFDCSFNALGDSLLYFKRPVYTSLSLNCLSNINIDNTKKIVLGTLAGGTGGEIFYNETTKYLTIASGTSNTNIYLRTNNAGGLGTYIDITPTTVTIPQSTNISGTLTIPSYANVSTELDGINTSITGINTSISNINTTLTDISYTTNYTTISNDVAITGAGSPIYFYPRTNPTGNANTKNAIIMVNNGNIVGGLINEVDFLVSYGINTPQFNVSRDTTRPGGLFRMDCRGGVGNPLFSVVTYDVGALSYQYKFPLQISGAGDTTLLNTAVAGTFGVTTSLGVSGTPSCSIRDANTGYQHLFLPASTASAYNTIVQAGDQVIVGAGNLVDVGDLTLTIWSNTKSGVRISPTNTTVERPYLNFADGTQMDTAEQLQREPSDADILSLESGFNVKATTIDIAGAGVVNTVILTANTAYYYAVFLQAGTLCTGIGLFKSPAAATTCYVALYDKGFQSARRALSASTALATGSAVQFIPFTAAYVIPTSGLYFVAVMTAANCNVIATPANAYLNHAYTVGTNGTLNKRGLAATMAGGTFPLAILSTQVVAQANSVVYMAVYS